MFLDRIQLKGKPKEVKTFKDSILTMLYEFRNMETSPKYSFLRKMDIPADVLIQEVEDETAFGKQLLTQLEQEVYDELLFRRVNWTGVSYPETETKKEETE